MDIYPTFSPTWAYIKQHNQTKLKYFGITTKPDPSTYRGSGKYWCNHIRQHGNDVTTLWYQLFTDFDELCSFTETFSKEHKIVESEEWANLIPELGRNGNKNAGQLWLSRKAKMSAEDISELHNKDSVGLRNYWKNITEEARTFRTRRGSEEVQKHWDSLSIEQRIERANKSGEKHKGKRLMQPTNQSVKPKMVMLVDQADMLASGWTYASLKEPKRIYKQYEKKLCPHCNRLANSSYFSRSHGENCKYKGNMTTLQK